MALVDHDQVEVVGRVVAEDAEAVAGVGERLVESEVDLPPGLDVALDLPDRVSEDRPELPADWLVDEDVAVNEVEDAGLPPRRRPLAGGQLPDDLKRDEGLSGPSSEREQDSLPARENRLERAFDRNALVVPWLLDRAVGIAELTRERTKQDVARPVVPNPFPGLESCPCL